MVLVRGQDGIRVPVGELGKALLPELFLLFRVEVKGLFMVRYIYIVLVCGLLCSCGGYREIQVDVLRPAGLEMGEKPSYLVFLDRKFVHHADVADAHVLERALGLSREKVVRCFYDGLRDGFREGVRKVTLEQAIGLRNTVVEDTMIPPLLSPMEVQTTGKYGVASHVLTLDYCRFRLDDGRIVLDDNLLLHLYRVTDGQVVDTLHSTWTEEDESYFGQDDATAICNFFYRKGRDCAAEITPSWMKTKRRIYTGNRWLKMGYYYLKEERFKDAYRLWSALLDERSSRAARAAVNMAWLYEQQGNFRGALNLLEAATKQLRSESKRGELLEYIESAIEVLRQREQDDKKILNQL